MGEGQWDRWVGATRDGGEHWVGCAVRGRGAGGRRWTGRCSPGQR